MDKERKVIGGVVVGLFDNVETGHSFPYKRSIDVLVRIQLDKKEQGWDKIPVQLEDGVEFIVRLK